MNCDPQTVAACVFEGHAAAHERHECPLVQMLVRRLQNLGIEDSPAHVDRELDKYRPVARVLGCPLVARLSLFDLRPQSVMPSLLDARSLQPPTPRAPLLHSAPRYRYP